MLRATVRYFDRDRSRPGLPRDVAALVDRLGPDGVGVHLVNLSRTDTPSTSVRIDAGLQRFANKPTYAFPWHEDEVPVI